MLFGIAPEDADALLGLDDEPEHFGVWPDNWLTLQVFLAMSTQWRWTGGMESRRAGLDFNVLPTFYEGLRVPKKKRPEVFQGLLVMEAAALDVLTKA